MKKKGLLFVLVMMVVTVGIVLSACAGGPVVYVYNWGEYIDPDVLKQFTAETGIKVKYSTFETNEDMYIKITSGRAKYDVIVPSDYMIDKLIKEELLQPLNYENIPNAQYIDPAYKSLAHDPDDIYSIPYIWGTLGIVYNTKMVNEPVDSWSILWDEKYKGNILMLDSIRDSFAVVQSLLGQSINSSDATELAAVKAKLLELKPLVRAWLVDKVISDMEANEAAIAVTWSCDFLQMQQRNNDLAYVIPKEGSNLWLDSMAIPKNAVNVSAAEQFINFMCREDIALANSEFLQNPTPQVQAKALQGEELRDNPAAYPSAQELERCEVFLHLGEDVLKAYDRIWTEIGIGQ